MSETRKESPKDFTRTQVEHSLARFGLVSSGMAESFIEAAGLHDDDDDKELGWSSVRVDLENCREEQERFVARWLPVYPDLFPGIEVE